MTLEEAEAEIKRLNGIIRHYEIVLRNEVVVLRSRAADIESQHLYEVLK